jgi:hypothetical protein
MIKMYPEKYGANNLANIYSERLKQCNALCASIAPALAFTVSKSSVRTSAALGADEEPFKT